MTDGKQGSLIRGADGSVYFIPDEQLESFRVPSETEEAINGALGEEDEVAGFGFGSFKPMTVDPMAPQIAISLKVDEANVAALPGDMFTNDELVGRLRNLPR